MPRRRHRPRKEEARLIGERIAALRKRRGLTQVQLASMVELTQSNISQYERGGMRPHCDLLIQLAKALNASADEILGLKPLAEANIPLLDRRLMEQLALAQRLSKPNKTALLRTIKNLLAAAIQSETASARTGAHSR